MRTLLFLLIVAIAVAFGLRHLERTRPQDVPWTKLRSFEGGRRLNVARDWRGDSAEAAFLRDAHRGACRVFGTTLGPDYNAAHADHFHLDMKAWGAGYGVCR